MRWILPLLLLSVGALFGQNDQVQETTNVASTTENLKAYPGFFPFYWDEKKGQILLEIAAFDQPFLYVNSLSAGVGSNDIGLDRNQLGDEHVVKFMRSGPKVLLVQLNMKYRANSDNLEERKAVEEAFAQSVLWGFEIKAEESNKVLIDFTPFLMRDAHKVVRRLKSRKQGKYKLEKGRSAVFLDRTKNFPKNSEFEAVLTFTGEPEGRWIQSVTPTPEAVTVRQHHSFIELPDDQYEPRIFDPRCGYFQMSYQDYATPIEQPLVKRFITRHRLEKKNPSAAKSEAVEPIIYYLDRGVPEPIRSALLEGASWWNQAYEAIGFVDAFQVKVLPEGADPMDVRYNMINWVHRSTRGWSYGSSIVDPRTGEILKGHVLLGSLRVRQDFLIAQGLIAAYENGDIPDPRLLEMALARLRQLSAHEVGHTIGLAHNFAASAKDRASVMDYPHPYITLGADGQIDFSKAYDDKIGDWDKRTILYGYSDFPDGTNEKEALAAILTENETLGFQYISDNDARPAYGAHPSAHLWDNGASPIEELRRLSKVRAAAMEQFGHGNIPSDMPRAYLEQVLVPLYLSHRYQVEAVAKMIGGVNYTYAVNPDQAPKVTPVEASLQKEALYALKNTLTPSFLKLKEDIIQLIPPQPMGYSRGRELFKVHTGLTFDPLGAAESAANHTIRFLLEPARLARIEEHHSRFEGQMSLYDYMEDIIASCKVKKTDVGIDLENRMMVEKLLVLHLLHLAVDSGVSPQVAGTAMVKINEIKARLEGRLAFVVNKERQGHQAYLTRQIGLFLQNPDQFHLPKIPDMPDGSPIGCGHH